MKKFAALVAQIPSAISNVNHSYNKDTKSYDISPLANILNGMVKARSEYWKGMYKALEFYTQCEEARPHILARKVQKVLADLEAMSIQIRDAVEVCTMLGDIWYDNTHLVKFDLGEVDGYYYMLEANNEFWNCIYHPYCESVYRNMSWKTQGRAKALLVKNHNEFAKQYHFDFLKTQKEEAEMLAWAMRVRKAV